MKILMKNKISVAVAALFLMSGAAAYAATTTENVDDASSIGTSDTPQIKRQEKRMEKQMDKKSGHKSMQKNNSQMKMMDTNQDGMVSKDEYMTFHEKTYLDMKPGENGISYKSSMNNKPIGTTTGTSANGSVDITKEGEPINGTTTGTNK